VARSSDPGIVVPAGHTFIASTSAGMSAYVWINGYKVSSTAI
jgi:hypothetical protein